MSSQDPGNPFAFALNAQRQMIDSVAAGFEKAEIADERLETIENIDVGQTPSEVVYEENKLELLHYESRTEEQHDVPILVTYALINKPFILDLQPDRSVVRRLLDAGHDVYLIDWNEPSRLDRFLTLDDYVNRYMDNCVDEVRERSGRERINLLGYCMGGTMSVMYAALHQEKVRTLGLMAAGLCFDGSGGVLELWGDDDYYDPEDVTETFGNVPAEMLDVGFALMDPVANYVSKYARLYDNLENDDFVENFARMERWLDEGIDLAGETYVQFLRDIYQDNKLYENELEVGGERVDVTEIEVPILQVIGEYDHLIPADASKPFNDVVGSDDVTTIEYPTGHIGLSVSGSSHRDVWPQVARWYFERSTDDPVDLDHVESAVQEAADAELEIDVTEGDLAEAAVRIDEGDGEAVEEVVDLEAEAVEAVVREAVDVEEEAFGPAGAEGSDLEEIGGLGPTDAERLREAGITTIRDLASADVETVAEAAEVDESEADAWLTQARDDFVGLQETEDLEVAEEDLQDVESIDGIGPTYAERLREAGIESVAALSGADVETVADAAGVSESRAGDWLDQARE